MPLIKISLALLCLVALSSGSQLWRGKSDVFDSDDSIFDSLLSTASSYFVLVKLYMEAFFETIGFKRGTEEWKFVEELEDLLRGVSPSNDGELDAVDLMLYGKDPSKFNITIPPALKNKTAACKLCLVSSICCGKIIFLFFFLIYIFFI